VTRPRPDPNPAGRPAPSSAGDRATGMSAVGVSRGFRPEEEPQAEGADAIIDRPSERLALLDRDLAG